MGGKFKFCGSDFAPFVANGTKEKIPSEIDQPLVKCKTELDFNKDFITKSHRQIKCTRSKSLFYCLMQLFNRS